MKSLDKYCHCRVCDGGEYNICAPCVGKGMHCNDGNDETHFLEEMRFSVLQRGMHWKISFRGNNRGRKEGYCGVFPLVYVGKVSKFIDFSTQQSPFDHQSYWRDT